MRIGSARVLFVLVTGMVGMAHAADLPTILKQQREIATQLEGKDVAGLTPRQANIIRKAQVEVFAIIEGKASMDQLDIEQKVRLENALQRINAAIVGTRLAGENQQHCWREKPSGSNIEVTRCGTQAEADQAREGARTYLDRREICVPPGCGS